MEGSKKEAVVIWAVIPMYMLLAICESVRKKEMRSAKLLILGKYFE